jgi:hypothetical protein
MKQRTVVIQIEVVTAAPLDMLRRANRVELYCDASDDDIGLKVADLMLTEAPRVNVIRRRPRAHRRVPGTAAVIGSRPARRRHRADHREGIRRR